MGAAASIEGEEVPDNERAEGEYHHGRYESGRIANSTRTGSNKSVRAMALKNHSRHENTYISADTISQHLGGSGRAAGKVEVEYPPDYKHRNHDKHELSMKLNATGISTISEAPELACEKMAPPVAAVSSGFGLFRSQLGLGLGLKLQLEEEQPEWSHVRSILL